MTRTTVSFANWFPVLVCGEWGFEPRPNYFPFSVVPNEVINHPSPKPLRAMMKLIYWYTSPGDVILDPFMGSGTTCLAAKRLGRHFIGCDIDPVSVVETRRRLALPYTPDLFERVSDPSAQDAAHVAQLALPGVGG